MALVWPFVGLVAAGCGTEGEETVPSLPLDLLVPRAGGLCTEAVPRGPTDRSVVEVMPGRGPVVPLADGDAVEIERGFQGGIHLYLRLAVPAADEAEERIGEVVVTCEQPCPGPGTVVASACHGRVPFRPGAAEGRLVSAPFPVIFERPEPLDYAGQACCLSVRVSWSDGEPAAYGGVRLLCVDEQ